MTTPSSGPISFGQVRTELNGSGPISLGDTAVRNLFGVASGPISMSSGYNKSAAITGYLDYLDNSPDFTVTMYPSGGNGSYSYSWTLNNVASGYNNYGSYITFHTFGSWQAYCTVTDTAGHSTQFSVSY